MGRRHHRTGLPQRSRLIADREERNKRVNLAFSLFRPATHETSESIYSRLRPLQQEKDIPEGVVLYTGDYHASIIQERRMRKGLVLGLASGFAVSSALNDLERKLPGMGRDWVLAHVTGVEVIGRNRNVLLAHIADKDGVLRDSRLAVKETLGTMGLKLTMDSSDHITLGVSKSGLSYAESVDIKEIVGEALIGGPIELKPVELEHDGQRLALRDARSQLAA